MSLIQRIFSPHGWYLIGSCSVLTAATASGLDHVRGDFEKSITAAWHGGIDGFCLAWDAAVPSRRPFLGNVFTASLIVAAHRGLYLYRERQRAKTQ